MSGTVSLYLHLLNRFTPGYPPIKAATEFLPWLFRWIALLLILPVLFLLAADFLTYVYFRIVYQPFGRARTAFYKFPGRWGSRTASATPSPPRKTAPLPSLSPTSNKSNVGPPTISRARASGIGLEGPLLDPQSPTAEDVPLPMIDEDEEEYFVG